MKLLHPEVEILPGRPGTRQAVSPVPEGLPLSGSAVVRVTNTSSQNNAYNLQLRCENNPYWQETWYRLLPLPPAPGDRNIIPPGKHDESGPQGATLKLYILSGGSREVLIQFNVPKSPEARAGRYPYTIEIETQVLNAPKDTERREARITRLPGIALVRPFYNWSFDLKKSSADPKPGEPKAVGRLRPTGALEVIITNESNDWLCCDLLLPQPNDLLLECPTRRVAVRPPELGEVLTLPEAGVDPRPGTQRSVPLYATSQLKTLRGTPMVQAIPLTVVRVDAPSVAPSAEDDFFAGTGKVIARATTEKQTLPEERTIVYRPPIPATLTEFFRRAFSSGRTLVLSALGILVAAHIALLMYEQIYYRNMHIALEESGTVPLGKPVRVTGKLLQGAVFSLGSDKDTDFQGIDEDHVKPVKNKPNEFELDLPRDSKLNGKSLKIRAQRSIPWLPYLTGLLPHQETNAFDYGEQAQIVNPAPDQEPRKVTKGQTSFNITGRNLGTHGYVFVNNIPVPTGSWTNSLIGATLPPDMKQGEPMPVELQCEGATTRIPAGSLTIEDGQAGSITGTTPDSHPIPQPNPLALGLHYKPGASLIITGKDLGKGGTVLVGGVPIKQPQWSGASVNVIVPIDAQPGDHEVAIQPDGSPQPMSVGSITVDAPDHNLPTPSASITVPLFGSHQIGETLAIQGQNLGDKGSVYLAGKRVRPMSWSSNRITFAVPATVPTGQSLSVEMQSSTGARLLAGTFSVPVPTPRPLPVSFTRMTVVHLPTGAKVLSILGQNLGSSMGTVSLAGTSVRVMKWNSKQIIVELNPSLPTGTQLPVTVKLPDNTQFQAGTFSIPVPTPVTVPASITVSVSGPHQVGETLTIQGQNLGDRGILRVAGKRVRPMSWSGNQIRFMVPPDVPTATSISVELRLPPDGKLLPAGAFTVPAPVVQPQPASITIPISGQHQIGEMLTIQGQNLGDRGILRVAGRRIRPMSWGNNQITFVVPSKLPTGRSISVEVQTLDGTWLPAGAFNVLSSVVQPQPASITIPISGQHQIGEMLTIQGQNLGDRGILRVAGRRIRPMSWGNSQITFVVPSKLPTGQSINVEMQSSDGTWLPAGAFSLPDRSVPPPPLSASIIGPVSGPHHVGEALIIRGQNLGDSPGFILLGGRGFRPTSWRNNQITFTVPPNMPIGRTIMVMVQLSNRTRLQAGVFSIY